MTDLLRSIDPIVAVLMLISATIIIAVAIDVEFTCEKRERNADAYKSEGCRD